MTLKELSEVLAKGGGLLFFGEYRGSSMESKAYMDKSTGKKREYVVMRHSVEVNNPLSGLETYHVQEYFDEIKEVKKLDIPRGARVFGEPVKITREGGICVLSCKERLQELKAHENVKQ
ncbi:MAG: hypothetical protein PHV34_20355 [Verrucomicrobiae bacterium]|nr:hypothetical protein [Verrucomicrobiae bacterium]